MAENNEAERRGRDDDSEKHACNDTILLGSNGWASDTVRARNTGLKEQNGKRT